MAYDKLVDSSKLDGALKSTANAIRGKTGKTSNIAWNESTGFKTAIDEIVVGSTIKAQSKTVTPTKAEQIITPDSGYNALSAVTVKEIPDKYIEPSGTLNITNNGTHDATQYASVNVNVPASGIDTSDATAADAEILSGKTAYVKGRKVTGTMANRGALNRQIDGVNSTVVTISAGYYSGGSVDFDSEPIEALLDAI